MNKIKVNPLTAKDIYKECPSKYLNFTTTSQITTTNRFIGQKRACTSIQTGLEIKTSGYNIFLTGQEGTGRTSILKEFLNKWAHKLPAPSDWIYVYNFTNTRCPQAIALSKDQGRDFKSELSKNIKKIFKEVPIALQSEEYEVLAQNYLMKTNEKRNKQFNAIEKKTNKFGFKLHITEHNIETSPIINNTVLDDIEYANLSRKQKTEIEKNRLKLEPHILNYARTIRDIDNKEKTYIEEVRKRFISTIFEDYFSNIFKKYTTNIKIKKYLINLKENLLNNCEMFSEPEIESSDRQKTEASTRIEDYMKKCVVNLLVDNSSTKHAPVVVAENLTYYNLFGKVERNVDHGLCITDFSLIRSGYIHQANGGYLVIDAEELFKNPHNWIMLKKVLKTQKAFIEEIEDGVNWIPTVDIRPEAINLDVKVIIVGCEHIYQQMCERDNDFSRIFKIKADFDDKILKNSENIKGFIAFIATCVKKEKLLSFSRTAIAQVVEYASRLIEHQNYLTARFSIVKDLIIESDYVARKKKQQIIQKEDVQDALEQKTRRVNLTEDHLLEEIASNTYLLSLSNSRVGQVNGLCVYDLGDYILGKPIRITSLCSESKNEIIDIERTSKLSGKIHTKGVLILTSIIKSFISKKKTKGLSISICFEQSYGEVDGDSSMCAELTAVISSINKVPIKQNLAITGSLNQLGDIQPVGGINEKIEGFYNVAKKLRKQNDCHVIIPQQNIQNLMLSKEVRDAVDKKWLKIWPTKKYSEVFHIATGVSLSTLEFP
jgi:lon-related putative ATP-dependent protease